MVVIGNYLYRVVYGVLVLELGLLLVGVGIYLASAIRENKSTISYYYFFIKCIYFRIQSEAP